MNVMMAHTFTQPIAEREELAAAYDRIDELTGALMAARAFIEGACSGQFYDENAEQIVDAIDLALEQRVLS